MTPTMALVARCEDEITKFKPVTYEHRRTKFICNGVASVLGAILSCHEYKKMFLQ